MKPSLFLLIAISTVPCAASTIDQSFVPGVVDLGADVNECCKFIGQTYTAGLTGTLAGIDLDIQSPYSYPLQVEIESVADGLPTGTILGQTTLGVSSVSLSTLITFSSTIQQVAGTQYAIVVDYPTAPFVAGASGQYAGIWYGNTTGAYTGGQLVELDGSTWSALPAPDDVFFQTVVDPTPEPSTAVMLLTASALAFAFRRRLFHATNS